MSRAEPSRAEQSRGEGGLASLGAPCLCYMFMTVSRQMDGNEPGPRLIGFEVAEDLDLKETTVCALG